MAAAVAAAACSATASWSSSSTSSGECVKSDGWRKGESLRPKLAFPSGWAPCTAPPSHRSRLTVCYERRVDQMKWPEMQQELKKKNVRSVSPSQARDLLESWGYKVLDVRPEPEFAKGSIDGAVNVSLYRPISGWSPLATTRRLGFAFFGVFNGTEINPNFVQDVKAVYPVETPLVVVCGMGGSMRPLHGMRFGKSSRSLIAAYMLGLEGYKTIVHLDGGLKNWFDEENATNKEAAAV
eukprot:jgi/Chlat1/401/Chrsp10S01503